MSEFTAGDPGPGFGAFVIFVLLAGATAFLLWSLVRQLRKVPKDLDVPLRPDKPSPPGDSEPDDR